MCECFCGLKRIGNLYNNVGGIKKIKRDHFWWSEKKNFSIWDLAVTGKYVCKSGFKHVTNAYSSGLSIHQISGV